METEVNHTQNSAGHYSREFGGNYNSSKPTTAYGNRLYCSQIQVQDKTGANQHGD